LAKPLRYGRIFLKIIYWTLGATVLIEVSPIQVPVQIPDDYGSLPLYYKDKPFDMYHNRKGDSRFSNGIVRELLPSFVSNRKCRPWRLFAHLTQVLLSDKLLYIYCNCRINLQGGYPVQRG